MEQELAFKNVDALYDVPTCAARLGNVSEESIRYWAKQGRLRITKIGARVMISEAACREFIAASNRSTKNPRPGVRQPKVRRAG